MYPFKIVGPGGTYTFAVSKARALVLMAQIQAKFPDKGFRVVPTSDDDYSDEFWTGLEVYCANL